MSTFWTFVRATAVVVGSSAALLMGGLMGTPTPTRRRCRRTQHRRSS